MSKKFHTFDPVSARYVRVCTPITGISRLSFNFINLTALKKRKKKIASTPFESL
jgi:hypothetical protein